MNKKMPGRAFSYFFKKADRYDVFRIKISFVSKFEIRDTGKRQKAEVHNGIAMHVSLNF